MGTFIKNYAVKNAIMALILTLAIVVSDMFAPMVGGLPPTLSGYVLLFLFALIVFVVYGVLLSFIKRHSRRT